MEEKRDILPEKSEIGNPLYCAYVDGLYTYKDPKTNNEFVWDEEAKRWLPKTVSGGGSDVRFDGENYTYSDRDGTVFEWDGTKAAWFPKLDEEFLVRYQLSYGVNNAGSSTSSTLPEPPSNPEGSELTSNLLKRKMPPAQPQPPQWFDLEDAQNTKVYVSNLPEDITDEEFVTFMSKCGLIMKDPASGQFKIKLYEDHQGRKKGDGLCSYIKIESVELALQILDGSDIRGRCVKVERAKFTLKGQYDPTKKPKSKKKKDKEKMKKQQEALFAWKPDKLRGERPKHERVVIVRNAFGPQDFEEDVSLILEYKQDFRDEAAKFGNCKKVVIFDNHPNGVMQIFMSTPEEADAVVTSFNNRFFGGKMLEAYLWDGLSKFSIEETDAERQQRLEKWEKFIAEEDRSGDSSGAANAKGTITDEDLALVEESMVSCPTTPPRLADS